MADPFRDFEWNIWWIHGRVLKVSWPAVFGELWGGGALHLEGSAMHRFLCGLGFGGAGVDAVLAAFFGRERASEAGAGQR